MHDKELYGQILGVTTPWTVSNVELDLKASEVRVAIAWMAEEPTTCPECRKPCRGYDRRERRWRHLDTCQLRTVLVVQVPRIECAEHGVRQVHVPWAEPGARFTALFEAVVIDWLLEAPIATVAERLRLTWDEVDGIRGRAVARGLKRRRRRPIQKLGVDETSYQKRHEYVTVLSDLERGVVVDVADDRTRAALEGLLDRMPEGHRAEIAAVAMDMSGPYRQAVEARVPQAERVIAYDRFHVAKLLNDRVNDVRKAEHRALHAAGDDRLKGARFLFLQRPEDLDAARLARLDALKSSGLQVARAWALKESARHLWRFATRAGARRAWAKWLGWAQRSRLEPMVKAARTIREHLDGIVNAVVLKVTGALCESLNAKIQRIKAAACGFRNRARFREAILFHCGGLSLYPAQCRATHPKA